MIKSFLELGYTCNQHHQSFPFLFISVTGFQDAVKKCYKMLKDVTLKMKYEFWYIFSHIEFVPLCSVKTPFLKVGRTFGKIGRCG